MEAEIPGPNTHTEQTKLAASIDTELTCVAVENEEYRRIMKQRFDEELDKQKTTTFLTGDVRRAAGMVLGGTTRGGLGDEGGFNNFIVSTILSLSVTTF